MAAITLPTAPGWQSVEASYVKARAVFQSPTTFDTQTQINAGESYGFRFTLPPMKETAGLTWIKFIRDVLKSDNHFVENVTKYVSSDVSDKASMQLRIVPGSESVSIDRAKIYRISFDAEKYQ